MRKLPSVILSILQHSMNIELAKRQVEYRHELSLGQTSVR